jgi:hypothetical protein
MPINPAATPHSEKPMEIGAYDGQKLDRRVSVAPMMDWTDELNRTNEIMNLDAVELA